MATEEKRRLWGLIIKPSAAKKAKMLAMHYELDYGEYIEGVIDKEFEKMKAELLQQ